MAAEVGPSPHVFAGHQLMFIAPATYIKMEESENVSSPTQSRAPHRSLSEDEMAYRSRPPPPPPPRITNFIVVIFGSRPEFAQKWIYKTQCARGIRMHARLEPIIIQKREEPCLDHRINTI